MPEIIQRGRLAHERVHTTKCTKCGTVFRFKESEAQSSSWRNETYFNIACPLLGCGATVSYQPPEQFSRDDYTLGSSQLERAGH